MVLQVPADARPIEHDGTAKLRKIGGRPDTGEQQKLRRADRAGGEDHLAANACDLGPIIAAKTHAGRATIFDRDAFDQTIGQEPQVWPVEHLLQETARRRPSASALLVDVELKGPPVGAAVETTNSPDTGVGGVASCAARRVTT